MLLCSYAPEHEYEAMDRFRAFRMSLSPHEIAIHTPIAFNDRCDWTVEQFVRSVSFSSFSSPDQNDEELFASAISETNPSFRRACLRSKTVEQHDKQPKVPSLVVVLASRVP